jgi:predicted DNA-binding transcriptional regulator AlpA
MPNQTSQSATRLIALPEVSTITSLRKTALYQLIKVGELRPVKLGRKTVFAESEIYAWVNQRLESRGA